MEGKKIDERVSLNKPGLLIALLSLGHHEEEKKKSLHREEPI